MKNHKVLFLRMNRVVSLKTIKDFLRVEAGKPALFFVKIPSIASLEVPLFRRQVEAILLAPQFILKEVNNPSS
jgi:hypothetical protein